MNYKDLTTFQRSDLATKNFLKVANRNVINQQKTLEKMEAINRGEEVSFEGDISTNISSLIQNMGTSYLVLNELRNLFYTANVGGIGGQAYLNIRKDTNIGQLSQIIVRFFNQLDIIDYNLKDVIKEIMNVGPENFNFKQLNDLFKIYEKFKKSFRTFVDFFGITYNADGTIDTTRIKDAIAVVSPLAGNFTIITPALRSVDEYIDRIDEYYRNIISKFEDIITISRERGTTKIEGYGKIPQRFM